MSCERIRQIATLLYVYDQLIPATGVREYRAKELNRVVERMFHHIEYYENCEMISSSFEFIKAIVDKIMPI